MRKIAVLLGLFVALALLAGCGVQKQFIKAYSGSDLPEDQVALIKPVLRVIIRAIDSDSTKNVTAWGAFGSTDADIALTPGQHHLTLAFGAIATHSVSDLIYLINVEAGRKYLLEPVVLPGLRWRPELKDVTGKPELWCVTSPSC